MSNVEKISESVINVLPKKEGVYYPILYAPPPDIPPILFFNGATILSNENILAIGAYIGVGKSSVCASIMASLINPMADTLGFKVNLSSEHAKILYVDTEMSRKQTYKMLWQMYKRSGIMQTDNRIIIANTKLLNATDRKFLIEEIIKNNPSIGLAIIDGAGDFVDNTNDEKEASLFYNWVKKLKPEMGIIITIHTNSPTQEKGRGHIGSEILRRCDSSLLLRTTDNVTYEATTDFSYGKNREAKRQSVFYKFCEEEKMFKTLEGEYEPLKPITKEKINKDYDMCEMMFANTGNIPLSYSYIISFIVKARNIKESGAKSFMTKLVNEKIIKKLGTGEYQLYGIEPD